MSWIDFALVLALISIAALGAERRLSGFLVGIGGVLLLRPLLFLADVNPFMALVVALAAGLGLSLIGRRIGNQRRGRSWFFRLLGGLGGLALGTVLVLSLATTFPLQINATGQIVYPPRYQGDVEPAMPAGYGPISEARGPDRLGRRHPQGPPQLSGGRRALEREVTTAPIWDARERKPGETPRRRPPR